MTITNKETEFNNNESSNDGNNKSLEVETIQSLEKDRGVINDLLDYLIKKTKYKCDETYKLINWMEEEIGK